MRKFLRPVTAVLALLCSVPILAEKEGRPDPGIGKYPVMGEHVEAYFGDAVIRTDGTRVYVLLDTVVDMGIAPDGLVDQWFTLEMAEPLLVPLMAHLPGASVVHGPRVLRVSTPDQRYELVVSGGERGEARGIAAAVTLPATRVSGIGLAHNKAATEFRIAAQLDRVGRVSSTCEGCFYESPEAGGSSGSCGSGGPGSTQCSAGYGSSSCSVSCAAGYYACCSAGPGYATCKCIRG